MAKKKTEEAQQEGLKHEQQSPLERIANALEGILKLGGISLWMYQYSRLDEVITPEKLASMKAMIHEFIHPEYLQLLRKKLSDQEYEERLKSILMKQRIYEYLLFIHNYRDVFEAHTLFPDAYHASDRWLEELVSQRDFRMVHLRQGGFYPDFSSVVNAALIKVADRLEKSAIGESRASTVQQMRKAAKWFTDVGKEYAEYKKKRRKAPLEYARIEEAGRKLGCAIPLSPESFQFLWVNGLDKEDADDADTTSVN